MGADTDVRDFESTVTKRPRLGRGGAWIRQYEPIMTAYKVVRIDVNSSLVPKKYVEQWAQLNGLQRNFLNYNRKVLRWIDKWFDLQVSDAEMLAVAPCAAASVLEKRRFVRARKSTLAMECGKQLACERAFEMSDVSNPFC